MLPSGPWWFPSGPGRWSRSRSLVPCSPGSWSRRGCPWGRVVAPWGDVTPKIRTPNPKMVWGHNLQHMGPFGATTNGFCMVFQPATLIFLTPDPFFGAPRSTSGPPKARTPTLGQLRDTEKHDFVQGLVPHEVCQDFLRGAWFPWYPETLWVYQFPPKPFQGSVFQGFPPNPKKTMAPPGPLVAPLGPLGTTRWQPCD